MMMMMYKQKNHCSNGLVVWEGFGNTSIGPLSCEPIRWDKLTFHVQNIHPWILSPISTCTSQYLKYPKKKRVQKFIYLPFKNNNRNKIKILTALKTSNTPAKTHYNCLSNSYKNHDTWKLKFEDKCYPNGNRSLVR